MENQKEKPEGEETTTTPEETGVQPEATNKFDRADATVKRLKEENDRTEKLVTRQEEIRANQILDGRTDAGQPKPTAEQEKEAESQKEADEIVKAFN